MWSIGIWKPMDRKFGLRPWLRKSITTRCGSMLRLPRKNHGTKLGHYILCDLVNYCMMVCMPCFVCVVECLVLRD